MANLPYFPFYPSDWLSSPRIMCLTLAEQGAYIRLLSVCWMSGDCSLPIEKSKLSILSGLPIDQLGPVQDLLRSHPTKSDALTNERLYKEWEKAHWISEARSKAGRKSGKSRRTHVQQMLEQNSNKKSTVADKSEVRIRSQNQTHNSDSDLDLEKDKDKKILSASASPRVSGKSVDTWNAYSDAYLVRYGVKPVRNAGTNAMLGKLVEKLGAEEAPHVAGFYLTHNNPFYVTKRHPTNLLLQDAEGLRTQWATGVKSTTNEARNMETKDNMREQHTRVMKLLNQGGEV